MREGLFSDINPQILGDVVISVETANNEARAVNLSLQNRFNQLLIHGILHLVGYDHETTQKEAQRMEEKSNELFAVLEKSKLA